MADDAPSKTANNKSTEDDFLRMTAQLVAAYLRKNSLPAAQITEIINSVHGSLRSIDGTGTNARLWRTSVESRQG